MYEEALSTAMRLPTIGNYADRTFYQGFPDNHDNQFPYLFVNRTSSMASVLSEGGFHRGAAALSQLVARKPGSNPPPLPSLPPLPPAAPRLGEVAQRAICSVRAVRQQRPVEARGGDLDAHGASDALVGDVAALDADLFHGLRR